MAIILAHNWKRPPPHLEIPSLSPQIVETNTAPGKELDKLKAKMQGILNQKLPKVRPQLIGLLALGLTAIWSFAGACVTSSPMCRGAYCMLCVAPEQEIHC